MSGLIFTRSSLSLQRPHTSTTKKIFTQRDLPQSSLRRKFHTATTYWPHLDHKLGLVWLWCQIDSYKELWEQTPGHNHALTTVGLLSKWKLQLRPPKQITISTRSHWQCVFQSVPSVGEIMQPETARWYQHISAPQSDGGRGGWGGREEEWGWAEFSPPRASQQD